jgi:hypothetical protein
MRRHKGTLAALVLITLSIAATGCRTMRPIELSGPAAPKAFAEIEIGDLVAIEMRDGSEHRFEVKGIEGETLVSEVGRRYPRSEIVKLQHESVDAKRTAGLVGSIVAGYAVMLKLVESGVFGR